MLWRIHCPTHGYVELEADEEPTLCPIVSEAVTAGATVVVPLLALADVADVDPTGATESQALVWHGVDKKWVPGAAIPKPGTFLITSWGGLVYDNAGNLVLK